MALLLRDRDATPEVVGPRPDGAGNVPFAGAPCSACGAAMNPGQDWCLECGTAAPGRLGARPGWRAAFTVVALTLLLVGSAVVASYAALTSDAQRQAALPSTGSGAPVLPKVKAPAKLVSPGDTGPGTVARRHIGPFIRIPGVQDLAAAKRKLIAQLLAQHKAALKAAAPPPPPPILPIKLAADAARRYDPYARVGADFGPAKNAVDDSVDSVWDVTAPADGAPIGAGIVIDLGGEYKLSTLKIDTPTPGFEMEVYGTPADVVPPDVLDLRWAHLANGKGVGNGDTIKLSSHYKGTSRFVALWITRSSDGADPRVALGDISFRGSK